MESKFRKRVAVGYEETARGNKSEGSATVMIVEKAPFVPPL